MFCSFLTQNNGISGTAFSALGVLERLYNVFFIWCQNVSWQLYFFGIFQNLALQNLQ